MRHDGSHVTQAVSLVALQTAFSNVPALQVVQASHVVWPVRSWKVPVVHAGHAEAPVAALAVPAVQSVQTPEEVAPETVPNLPGTQPVQTVEAVDDD